MIDYYKVLGVKGDSSEDEIKKAWRRIARECHPDRGHNDERKEMLYRAANEAQRVLLDPEKRKEYDESLLGGAYGSRLADIVLESLSNIGEKLKEDEKADPWEVAQQEIKSRQDEIWDVFRVAARSALSGVVRRMRERGK